MMVITQKITSVAFEIHDGEQEAPHSFSCFRLEFAVYLQFDPSCAGMARKEEHLTPGQKILAIRFVSLCSFKEFAAVNIQFNVSLHDFCHDMRDKHVS